MTFYEWLLTQGKANPQMTPVPSGGMGNPPASPTGIGTDRSALMQALMRAGLTMLSQGPSPYPISPMGSMAKGALAGLDAYGTAKRSDLYGGIAKEQLEMQKEDREHRREREKKKDIEEKEKKEAKERAVKHKVSLYELVAKGEDIGGYFEDNPDAMADLAVSGIDSGLANIFAGSVVPVKIQDADGNLQTIVVPASKALDYYTQGDNLVTVETTDDKGKKHTLRVPAASALTHWRTEQGREDTPTEREARDKIAELDSEIAKLESGGSLDIKTKMLMKNWGIPENDPEATKKAVQSYRELRDWYGKYIPGYTPSVVEDKSVVEGGGGEMSKLPDPKANKGRTVHEVVDGKKVRSFKSDGKKWVEIK